MVGTQMINLGGHLAAVGVHAIGLVVPVTDLRNSTKRRKEHLQTIETFHVTTPRVVLMVRADRSI